MTDRVALLSVAAIGMIVLLGYAAESVEDHGWKATILQLNLNGEDPDLTLKLKEAIVPLQDPPTAAEALARAYRAAASVAVSVIPVIRSTDRTWSLVAAGPLLDNPDGAQVRSSVLEHRHFRIEVIYTNARLRGAGFRSNLPWRPLLNIVVQPGLPPAAYEAEVVWRPLEAIPNGKELAPPHTIGPISFRVEGGH